MDHTRVALDVLAGEVARCEKCPPVRYTNANGVRERPIAAEVCFVGDAPREGDELFPGDVGELSNAS